MVSAVRPDTPSSHSNDTTAATSDSAAPLSLPQGFGTRAIHTASNANPETGAVIPPISLSTTYKQDAIGVHKGFEYTRSDNPNRRDFEELLASLEAGGKSALALASGSSATALVINSLGPKAHVLSVNDVYGGTARYLTKVASFTQGVETTFADLENASDEEIAASFRPQHQNCLDNTFLSPFYSSPLLLGADLVIHSITKYINGHSDVLMGAIILPQPSPSKPDAVTLDQRLRFLQNAVGAVPGAYDSWLAQRGAKTLQLRMKTHGTNALAVARFLQTRGRGLGLVDEVIYPGLASTSRGHYRLVRDHLLSPHARRWIDKGVWEGVSSHGPNSEDEGIPFGGMVSFRIAHPTTPSLRQATLTDPSSTAERFLTSTHIFTLAESLGGVEGLAELPAKMTHGGLPVEAREALGISSSLIRLSVGVEDIEDILVDLERALRWAVHGEKWDGASSSKAPDDDVVSD
ncbi:hypothetical protein BS47DRAFT_1352456 [Hydnum rufescens UP504]|uniref:cystathionine gamma-lyase n=1 Tax=Hydnum rufescens UP504 TaxID=1448309 RepID=A0A9P6DMA6_9AGAM|nr:hypothetical protein BS47DRAFT_1352456 [Hydnum rufescens UP504]